MPVKIDEDKYAHEVDIQIQSQVFQASLMRYIDYLLSDDKYTFWYIDISCDDKVI
jgi:hypothetical protein